MHPLLGVSFYVMVLGRISWSSPDLLCGSGSQLFWVGVFDKTRPGPGVCSREQGFGMRNGLLPKYLGPLPEPWYPGTDLSPGWAQVIYHITHQQSNKISLFSSRICNLRKILLVVSYDHFCFWISNGASGGG